MTDSAVPSAIIDPDADPGPRGLAVVTPDAPALSVVLVTFNRERLVVRQLEALARQRWEEPWEVVVSDNGSTDDTLAVVERYRDRLPGLRVVDASDRRGYAHALNIGAEAARGVALAFVNDDDEVGDGWVAAIGRALEQSPFVAARLDSDRLNPPWIVDVRGRPQSVGLWRWYRTGEFAVAFGSSIGIRRELLEEIGGFDEELRMYEDADLSLRLHRAGYAPVFVGEAVVHLGLRESLGGVFRQAVGYGETLVAFYSKHLPELERPPRGSGLRGWVSVVRLLVAIRDRASLGRFLWQLGWRVGLLRGSLKHRLLLLSE